MNPLVGPTGQPEKRSWTRSPRWARARRNRSDELHKDREGNRRWSRSSTILICLLVITSAVIGIYGWQTHSTYRTTARQAIVDRGTLAHARARLAMVRKELGTASAGAKSDAAILKTANDKLTAVRSQLGQAKAALFIDGVSIASLNSCLAGVENAVNLVALANTSGAAHALDGVATACRTAGGG